MARCSLGKCEARIIKCGFCGGAGQVSKEAHDRYMKRHNLRNRRVKRGYTQRELAHLLKISPIELNDIEMGRRELPVALEAEIYNFLDNRTA
jgi:DNA-binding XRE family transcriptional regulator